MSEPVSPAPRPYTLIAELTYRCPLKCPYCSNPVDFGRDATELTTDEWCRVFGEAEALGVMTLNLTGGEPLARKDLEALVARGRALDLYVNLITSGVPLTRERLLALRDAGVDNVQVSVQGTDRESSDAIAGYPCFDAKLEVARWVKEAGLALTLNIVLHAGNIESTASAVALAEKLGADRLELANTQYLGWALANRDVLLPTKAQLDAARAVAAEARARLEGRMEVLFVVPDYYAPYPRACMDGWGRRFIHVVPSGLVLPCHAAQSIPGLEFWSVRDRPLADVWRHAPAMNAFRGDAWMPETCRDCDRKEVDFGGCRCQALALTGDARAVDPACSLAPRHDVIEAARLARLTEATEAPDAPRRYLYRSARGVPGR